MATEIEESNPGILRRSLSDDEYESIESGVRSKIEAEFEKHIQEYLVAESSFRTSKDVLDKRIADLEASLQTASNERDDVKVKWEAITVQFDDVSKRLSVKTVQLEKHADDIQNLKKEVEQLRKERNNAVDELQVIRSTSERREVELDRARAELASLNVELRSANRARLEALVLGEDAQAKLVELEHKERRFTQEKELLTVQVRDLTGDLKLANEELSEQRRSATSNQIDLQTKIIEMKEELRISKELNEKLTKVNEDLQIQLEEVTDKYKDQMAKEDNLIEVHRNNVKKQTQLTDHYKEELEQAKRNVTELTKAVEELQQLLKQASDEYGDLETRYSQLEADSAAELEAKEETISALKAELHNANKLLEAVKQESSETAMDKLSPMAASTSKLLKSGLTLSQVYKKYADTIQELLVKEQENERLKSYMDRILKEIEEKAPMLAKQQEDYHHAVESLEILTQKMNDLENEQSHLRISNADLEATNKFLSSENKKQKTQINDMSRQVCYLLREVEAARGNHIPLHLDDPVARADALTPSEVIAKHLVTFKDIKDLQLTNQKLLAALRELQECKEAEELDEDDDKVKALKAELEKSRYTIEALASREKFLEKQVDFIKKQRDTYERMYDERNKSQQLKDSAKDGQSHNDSSLSEKTALRSPASAKSAAAEVVSIKKELEELKKEYETYRQEKKINENLLNETIAKMRDENGELMRTRAEATWQASFYQEKVKALSSKVEWLTNEHQRSQKLVEAQKQTVARYEAQIQQNKNDVLEAMKKVSTAELQVSRLTEENRVLKRNEEWLQKQKEFETRERVKAESLMASLDQIRLNFEEAEKGERKRLVSELGEANLECSNLRRRLQDEQDRLNRKVDLLEEQCKTAKARLEEQKQARDKIAEELEAAKAELREKEERIEEMQEQLTTAVNRSQPVLERERNIKRLEGIIAEKDTAIQGLNTRLEAAMKNCDESAAISQDADDSRAKITKEFEEHKIECARIIDELKKNEAELKSVKESLEAKLNSSSAEELQQKAQQEEELKSLRSRCEGLTVELEETKEKKIALEKESDEAMRSARVAQETISDLSKQIGQLQQELGSVRSELEKASDSNAALEMKYKMETEQINDQLKTLQNEIARLKKINSESEERIKQLTDVNDSLLEKVQQLGQKVSIFDAARAMGETVPNESSETIRQSDEMLKVLDLLRADKAAAVSSAEHFKKEKQRMEAEMEVLKKQIDELRGALERGGPSSKTSMIAADQHSQLLSKVEMLNELTESHKVLQAECTELRDRLAAAEKQLANVDAAVVNPNKEKIANLEAQVELLSTQNIALKAENQRWKDRTNEVIEKHNKNPDEKKRLIQEKENLAKQLTIEQAQHKNARVKLEELLLAARKEKENVLQEHNATKEALAASSKELASIKEAAAKAMEKATKLEQDLAAQEATLQDSRNKEMQIRQIARKYKIQCQEQTKMLEEKNKAGPSQQVLLEAEDRVKQLSDQVMSLETDNEELRRENDSLKAGVVEREERAKSLLKNARARVQTLAEENKSLSKELADRRGRGPGESSTGTDSVQTRNLENRIARLEKEKDEESAEKERLIRELEILTQRHGILQRQLEKYQQQGAKPSTSGGEKLIGETPTANIKPLSGPTTSTSKQTHQAQIAVNPWRETPFASIRPMSSQPRTVVVLPPRQSGSSTSSQPVLVAPQQQVVHTSSTCEGLSSSPTSSHIDYMPATSCAAHNIHPNTGLSVIIGQHMEMEGGNEDVVPPAPAHHVQPNQNAAVALVLPQPTAQQPSQAQGEAASTESVSGVVSASNQEQVSEQSVSASNHCTIGMAWRNVDEPSGAVASSQQIEQGSSSSVASVSGTSAVPGCSTIAASSQQAASSTTSVTTTVAPVLKRPQPSQDDADAKPLLPAAKRSRLMVSQGEGSGEMLLRSDGLEVEYQVPTSSQRDQEDDILVVSDDDDLPDDGAMDEAPDFEEEGEEETRYEIDTYRRDNQDIVSYEEGDGPDIDEGSTTDQENNEVDIDDSNEVPNQSSSLGAVLPSVAGASGDVVEGSAGTGGEATSSLGSTTSSQDYHRGRRLVLQSYEEPGDDSIVPSTPTLFVPRRTDVFGEAVSSPHVPSARFTFADPATTAPPAPVSVAGVAQVASEGMDDTRMDLSTLDEGTGRSVPTTPSHVSPQDPSGPEIGQSSSQELSLSGSSTMVGEGSAAVPDEPLSEQQEPTVEDVGDGVSSEGEKNSPSGHSSTLQVTSDADVELDEGREAEPVPAGSRLTVSASSSHIRGNMARRTVRFGMRSPGNSNRGIGSGRSSGPTPIVWSNPEHVQSGQGGSQQLVSMNPIPMRDFSGRMRGVGSSRPERPTPGYRGRPRRPRMSPFHQGNFGPRF